MSGGVLRDGAVAGELARAAYVDDRLARPGVRVPVQGADLRLRPDVGGQVGQVHVVIAVRQQRVPDRTEDARLAAAEIVGEDQVQAPAAFPARARSATRGCTSRGCSATCSAVRPNRKKFSSPASWAISMVAPSRVPTVRAPFIMNFMLLVPLAS